MQYIVHIGITEHQLSFLFIICNLEGMIQLIQSLVDLIIGSVASVYTIHAASPYTSYQVI